MTTEFRPQSNTILPDPPLAPLTAEDFDMGLTYEGVSLVEDEDARYVIAFGHIEAATMVAATHAYDRDMCGDDSPERHEVSDVSHVYAVTVLAKSAEHDWWASWHDVSAETPGSFAVTVVNR